MIAAGALLAQVRPASTAAAAAFTAPAGQSVEITRIEVCNTTGTAADASLYHDDAGGSTFDQTTALRYAKPVAANDALTIQADIGSGIVLSPGGQIAVQSSAGNALTFSFYGSVETRAPG